MAKATKTDRIIAKLKGKPEPDWPPVAELAEEFGCDNGTVYRAQEKLKAMIANPIKGEVVEMPLADLTIDPEIQMRPGEDKAAVARYRWAYEQGEPLPPLLAFRDPKAGLVRLTAGFHRRLALIELGLQTARVEVREGTRADAIEYATQDNATHGLPRCRETQRKSVVAALALPKFRKASTQVVADHCKVSWDLVDAIRKGYDSVTEKRKAEAAGEKRAAGPEVVEVTRDGKTFEVAREKLGRKKEVPTSDGPEPDPEEIEVGNAEPEADSADAWLETLPLSKNANIDQDAFVRQALAYRELQPYLADLKAAAQRAFQGQPEDFGQLAQIVLATLGISHPRDWPVCPLCKGKGKVAKQPCSCKGGFHVR